MLAIRYIFILILISPCGSTGWYASCIQLVIVLHFHCSIQDIFETKDSQNVGLKKYSIGGAWWISKDKVSKVAWLWMMHRTNTGILREKERGDTMEVFTRFIPKFFYGFIHLIGILMNFIYGVPVFVGSTNYSHLHYPLRIYLVLPHVSLPAWFVSTVLLRVGLIF